MSIIKNFEEINNRYLDDLNKYFEDNYDQLTGNDIHDIYFNNWRKMKKIVGSSSQVTWLAEFSIFHCLKMYLTKLRGRSLADWKIEPIRPPTSKEENDGLIRNKYVLDDIILGHEIPFYVNGKGASQTVRKGTQSPDFSIQINGKLVSIIEVKLIMQRKSSLSDLLSRIKKIKSGYPELKCSVLNVIYRANSFHDALEQYREKHDWFDFDVLQTNKAPFKEILCRLTGLEA